MAEIYQPSKANEDAGKTPSLVHSLTNCCMSMYSIVLLVFFYNRYIKVYIQLIIIEKISLMCNIIIENITILT